ncbi:MAG: hypothetical protein M5R40_29000 [Anaerolineae bacterium]|nr:hypothetical protein [Anaerolineae bacterium]
MTIAAAGACGGSKRSKEASAPDAFTAASLTPRVIGVLTKVGITAETLTPVPAVSRCSALLKLMSAVRVAA